MYVCDSSTFHYAYVICVGLWKELYMFRHTSSFHLHLHHYELINAFHQEDERTLSNSNSGR